MTIEQGKLVRWVDDKGFGFIKPESGSGDIFIHISALAGMSRKPVIGDIILYQIGFDANGKTCAVNAKIEGVSQILSLAPLERKRKKDLSTPIQERVNRKPGKINNPKKRFKLLPLLIVVVAVFIYDKVSKEKTVIDRIKMPMVETSEVEQAEPFQCQGKIWCSQMSSSEEALFYLRHCPGTKMDGDNDGIPCERQFQ
jgi:cold shock CspA family protein